MVEVKVSFIYTMVAPQGDGKLDFPLRLPLQCWPVNSFFSKAIFIFQAELHELEEIDSLCLWLFNQKRIPAENRQ